jgi:hypothetical protein
VAQRFSAAEIALFSFAALASEGSDFFRILFSRAVFWFRGYLNPRRQGDSRPPTPLP